jgi:hypothetical protein
MYRITDPEKSRAFYEALGLEFRREMDVVRNGEKEACRFGKRASRVEAPLGATRCRER